MSQAYSRGVQPPAPALSIRLRCEATDQSIGPLLALVDTGADATIVPLQHLLEIGAEESAPGWLRGVIGERLPVKLYFVDIRLGDVTIPGLRVIGHPQAEDILLGRDMLNKLALFLDGPEQQAEILDDATASRLRVRR
jgi:predicted aspartyl protease